MFIDILDVPRFAEDAHAPPVGEPADNLVAHRMETDRLAFLERRSPTVYINTLAKIAVKLTC